MTRWLWSLPFVWMGVIFLVSSQPFSSAATRSVLASLVLWVFPEMSPATVETANIIMRKLGHLTAYAVLGLCWYLPLSRRLGGWCRRPALVVMALCVAYAALDEWRQSFVPGRTASPGDVLIDGVGAALAQVALLRKHRE